MANNLINVVLKIKRGVTSALTASKTILEDGELVAEITTDGKRYLKIGDGTNTWVNSKNISAKYADSASTSTKATQDESGNNIKQSYASSLSVSGTTLTLLSRNGDTLSTVTVGTEKGGVETIVKNAQPSSPSNGLIWINDTI